jgi:hypothetical protein
MTAVAKNGSWIVWVILIAGGAALYAGLFYQTGQQWFDACWAKANANGQSAKSPEEAIAWAQCEETTNRALFNAGYTFSGNPEYAVTPALKLIVASCPSNFNDIPIGGVDLLAVSLVQSGGGPRLADRFLPPDHMILRAFNAKWPTCIDARDRTGIPKIVKQQNGEWAFASRCEPCEAEKKAMTQ